MNYLFSTKGKWVHKKNFILALFLGYDHTRRKWKRPRWTRRKTIGLRFVCEFLFHFYFYTSFQNCIEQASCRYLKGICGLRVFFWQIRKNWFSSKIWIALNREKRAPFSHFSISIGFNTNKFCKNKISKKSNFKYFENILWGMKRFSIFWMNWLLNSFSPS